MTYKSKVLELEGLKRSWAAIGNWLVAPICFLRRCSQRRKDLRHLEGLKDHQLRDIGLRRDQIDAALSGLYDPRYGKLPQEGQQERRRQ